MTDDDDLRERLRRADPAAALAPAAPDQVRQLTEEVMSRSHTRRWALPVAAALVLLAGGAAWAMTRPTPAEPIVSAPLPPSATAASAAGSAVRLTTSGIMAKCVEPTASRLSEISDFAFAGTVGKIDDGLVTLDVTRVFRGEPATRVQVEQQSDAISEQMLGSGTFEPGKDYLVAANDGEILICGYSGEADSIGLRDLYEAAF